MSDDLERLAGVCLFPGFPGLEPPPWITSWVQDGLGGVVLFGRNVESRDQLRSLTDALRAARGDVLVAIDEEGGDVTRLEAATGSSYPGNAALGAVDDVELTEQVAAAIAWDLVDAGVNLNLAPVADVNTNPANPVIGIRSFGSDAQRAAKHSAAFVRGTQSAGVIACAKHFPGHGDTDVDSHLELPTVPSLSEEALLPFRAVIDAGVMSIMTAHILVASLGDEPATTSSRVLQRLLREELGFIGMVMTDALEMRAISATVGMEEGAVRALQAGADALCLGHDVDEHECRNITRAIAAAVRSGRLLEGRLAQGAERVRLNANWAYHSPRGDRVGPEIGSIAARRAIRSEGIAKLSRPALLVALEPEPSIAAGRMPTPVEWLGQAMPEAEVVRVSEGETAGASILDERQLVLVVRDAHRHAWQRAEAEALLARSDDAIVVEVGLPHWRPPGAAGYLATYGAGRVNVEAAAERLAGKTGAEL
jgi:beta-N-acetylhexosaminidase